MELCDVAEERGLGEGASNEGVHRLGDTLEREHLRDEQVHDVGFDAGAVLQRSGHLVGEACARLGVAARAVLDLCVGVTHDLLEHDVDAQLFDSELSVSPAVAHLLRLIDHVGDPAPTPAQTPVGAPGLTVPEWSRLFPPAGDVPRAVLTCHLLCFGATGAGKTASVVLPVLQAALRAPRGRFSGGLVLDPKRELAVLVEREAPGRLHLLNPLEAGIDLMAGEVDALAQLLRQWRYREVAQRILLRALSFERHLPTRVMLDHQAPQYTTNSEFWDREGTALLTTVVAFVLMLVDPRISPPEDWLGDAEPECRWVCALRARARGGAGERGDNVLALAAWVFDSAFAVRPVRDGSDSPFGDMPDWRFGRVARAARSVWVAKGEATDIVRQVLEYWIPLTETGAQFRTIVASARAACGAAAEPALARTVYFGCEPGASSAYETGDAIGRAAGTDPDGPVLVYQPSDSGADVFLAKAIKALFFERASAHPERVRGGAELPLACYVADEAHRFVTSDPAHGDQGFVDRARSLAVFSVYACQSIASMEHALAQRGGGQVQDRSALSIMLANTASKLFLYSSELPTANFVDDLCPLVPGFTPLTHIRPLSSLAVGECYAALADGRFERRQLEPVLLARDGADGRVESRVLALPAPPASRVASGSES